MRAFMIGLALLSATSIEAAKQTLEFSVLTLGKVSGSETLRFDQTSAQSRYQFNDRGRGPEIDAQWQLDANGHWQSLKISGKGYFKAPLQETFAVKDGKAQWRNQSEQGESVLQTPSFFIPFNATPAMNAVLVRALLRAPDQEMSLLPGGRGRARQVAELSLAASKSRPSQMVRAYQLTGFGYEPSYVWLDQDLQFFADVSGWFTVIRKGAEQHASELLAAQTKLEDAYRQALSAKFLPADPAQPKAAGLLIHNARLFDPQSLAVTAKSSVLVIGKRIVRVGYAQTIPLTAEQQAFTQIDAQDRFLMPGLWDNHGHINGADAVMNLAAGVTTVRDMANDEQKLPAQRDRIEQGSELGPRLLLAGFMDGRSPFSGPTRALVNSAEEAKKWVDFYADRGYVQIKVYSSLDPKLFPAIAEHAHARGLRVSGHVPAFMNLQQFLEAGADEVQHMNFVFLNFLYKQYPDTRDMTRFTAVGQHAVELSPLGDKEQSLIKQMAVHGAVLDATINIFEGMYLGADDRIMPGYQDVVRRLPITIARGFKGGQLSLAKGHDPARYRRAFGAMLVFLKAMHDAGVTLLPGTDSPAGFGLHRELELWVQAGISAPEVLRAATMTSAQVNRRGHDLGRIAPTMLADLILLDGDPTNQISDIRKVRTIVRDGVVFDAADLYRAIDIEPVQ